MPKQISKPETLPTSRAERTALSSQRARLTVLPDSDPKPMSCTTYGAAQQPCPTVGVTSSLTQSASLNSDAEKLWSPAYKPDPTVSLISVHCLWLCPGRVTSQWTHPIAEHSLKSHSTRGPSSDLAWPQCSLQPHPTRGHIWRPHPIRQPSQQPFPTVEHSLWPCLITDTAWASVQLRILTCDPVWTCSLAQCHRVMEHTVTCIHPS